MNRIKHSSGAIEYVDTPEEKKKKDKMKDVKKASDLTTPQMKELIYEIAKKMNLI